MTAKCDDGNGRFDSDHVLPAAKVTPERFLKTESQALFHLFSKMPQGPPPPPPSPPPYSLNYYLLPEASLFDKRKVLREISILLNPESPVNHRRS